MYDREPKPYVWVPDPSFHYQPRPEAPDTQEKTEGITLPQPVPVPTEFEPDPPAPEDDEAK